MKDSRVAEADNEQFLDLMEDYFNLPEEELKYVHEYSDGSASIDNTPRKYHRRLDERPEVGYQVGVTLENTEKPKCKSDASCLNIIRRLDPSERPLDVEGI